MASEGYFTREAYDFLRDLIEASMQGMTTYREEVDSATRKVYPRVRAFHPTWDHLHRLFEHQAGAVSNLAEEAVTVLYTLMSFQYVISSRKKKGRHARPLPRGHGVHVMRQILMQRIRNTALSDAEVVLSQLEQVEMVLRSRSPSSSSSPLS